MKTVEQLETELRDALARERQLREALVTCQTCATELGYIGLPLQTIRAALTTPAPRVFTAEELNDICEIDRTEIANLKEQVRVFESWHKDPRVFTVEDVKPLVEALHEAIESSIAHISGSIQSGSPLDRWIKTLTHARKLGMEGGE